MLSQFLLVTLLQILAVVSPGPDFAIVVKNNFMGNRKSGIYTALGVTLGVTFHLSYCLLGFALIIQKSHLLFNIIKYLGGSYLIYIGIKGLFSRAPKETPFLKENFKQNISLSNQEAFRQGLFTNMLNPKAALYFIGLFTLVVQPTTPVWAQLGFSGIAISITFIWFSLLSVLLSHPKISKNLYKVQVVITRLMGLLLIIFGAKILLLKHP